MILNPFIMIGKILLYLSPAIARLVRYIIDEQERNKEKKEKTEK